MINSPPFTHPSLCLLLSSPVSIPSTVFFNPGPFIVFSPLLCSRGLYFTVPWVLLSDSTTDPEAARKSYSALYQKLCCLTLTIRRALMPSSLHDHHHSWQTQSCHTGCTHNTQDSDEEILCTLCLCSCMQVAEWGHVVRSVDFIMSCGFIHICIIHFFKKCITFVCVYDMELEHEMRDSACIPVSMHVCVFDFIYAAVSLRSGSKRESDKIYVTNKI